MDCDFIRGFWSIKGIENIILKMEMGEELYFTLDKPEDIEINGEPSGWYGIRKDTIFDGDVLLIGYMGGNDTVLYNVDFKINESDFGTVADCIDTYILRYLSEKRKEMLFVEYRRRKD